MAGLVLWVVWVGKLYFEYLIIKGEYLIINM